MYLMVCHHLAWARGPHSGQWRFEELGWEKGGKGKCQVESCVPIPYSVNFFPGLELSWLLSGKGLNGS